MIDEARQPDFKVASSFVLFLKDKSLDIIYKKKPEQNCISMRENLNPND
jgi:hypothetical protein